MGSHPGWLAVTVVAVASCVMTWARLPGAQAGGAPAAVAQGRAAKAPNPHFKPDGCTACHAGDAGGKPTAIASENVDALCLSCHDGVRAAAEAHPVGVPVAAGGARAEFPLVNGRLGCATCHDVGRACDANVQRPAVARERKLLREAPVKAAGASVKKSAKAFRSAQDASQAFCANCHAPASYERFNPHLMRDEGGAAIDAKCGFCHEKPMDVKATARTGEPALRRPEQVLCRSCHSTHPDPAPNGHVGATLTPERLAFIRAREVSGLLGAPSKPLLEQLQAEKARPRLLAVGANDTVACSTCHNPHLSGTFPAGSALNYRAMKAPAGLNTTVAPVRGDAWCRHCHDF